MDLEVDKVNFINQGGPAGVCSRPCLRTGMRAFLIANYFEGACSDEFSGHDFDP